MANQTKQARRDRQGRRWPSPAASRESWRTPASARPRRRRGDRGISAWSASRAAEERLAEAEEAVRDDDTIRIALPGTAVPAGRTVLTVRGLDGAWLPWRPAAEAGEASEEATPGALDELDRPRARAGRAHRAERRGQDHPAARISPGSWTACLTG